MTTNKKFSNLMQEKEYDRERFVCVSYYVETTIDLVSIAEAIAFESSVGTWTGIPKSGEAIYERFKAKVFEIKKTSSKKGIIKIGYPLDLFEKDNIPQIIATVAGSVFGIRNVVNLRVRDIELPSEIIKAFKGPQFGIGGVREILKVYDRPLLGTTIKPKIGLSTKEYCASAYKAWKGGMDIIFDDENLTDQDINPFYARVTQMIEVRRKVEEETQKRKIYFPNISARMSEMYARGKFVREMGGRGVMIDVVSVGFSGLQFMREQELGLLIHGRRALHGAFTHSEKHGISMVFISKLARLAGVDLLHSGTVAGETEGTSKYLVNIGMFLRNNWGGLKSVLPVASGALHPGFIPEIVRILGHDIVINCGGAVFGHPQGIQAGAEAIKQALEATLSGQELATYAIQHDELKQALALWTGDMEMSTYTHALAIKQEMNLTKT
jgi:ribulose-bisphosphate carboxylase large chain